MTQLGISWDWKGCFDNIEPTWGLGGAVEVAKTWVEPCEAKPL